MQENIATYIRETSESSGLERELHSTTTDDRSNWQKFKDYYFEPREIERWNNGRIYEWIGVKYFKNFVTTMNEKMMGHRNQTNYFLQSLNEEGLQEFIKKTRFNEGGHAALTIPAGIIAGAFLTVDPAAPFIMAPGIFVNVYCVIAQRYNRARLYNVLEKMQAREQRKLYAANNYLSNDE